MRIALHSRPGPRVERSMFFTGSTARINTAEACPSRSVTTFMQQCIPYTR